MAGRRLMLPPDDIDDWHHVPVLNECGYLFQWVAKGMGPRDQELMRWLRREITGPYYVRSHPSPSNGQMVDVYCFRDPSDALLFSLTWS